MSHASIMPLHHYFAALTTSELNELLVLFAGMMTAFFGFQKYQASQFNKIMENMARERELGAQQASLERRSLITSAVADRENEREERQKLTEAINRMASSNERIADKNDNVALLTQQSYKILEQLPELIKQLADRNFQAITNIHEQHVDKQIVDNEVVNKRCRRKESKA